MPFTPFHMGPALLVKSMTGSRFSVWVFGVSQIAIDIEPLVRIMRGDSTLHGFTHTLTGALLVGAAAAVVGRPTGNWFFRVARTRTREEEKPGPASEISWTTSFVSAWVGTGSHLILDGIMHADMHPFAPLTAANPLLGVIGLGSLHLLCIATGALGLAIMLLAGLRRSP